MIHVAESGAIYLHNADVGSLRRLDAGGALDTAFNPPVSSDLGGSPGYFGNVYEQEGGKLVLSGIFAQNAEPTMLTRLLPDGSVDPSFSRVAGFPEIYGTYAYETAAGGFAVRYSGFFADGMIFVEGLRVTDADGQPVPGFPPDNYSPRGTEELQDGSWIVTLFDDPGRRIARYTSSYQLDPTFSSPVFTDTGYTLDMSLWEWDTGFFLRLNFDAGTVTSGGQPARNLYRLLANGSVDPAFAPYLAPLVRGEAPYYVSIQEVSDEAPEGEELLLALFYRNGFFHGEVHFKILDAQTGKVRPLFNPVIRFKASSDDYYGEFRTGDVIRVAVDNSMIDVNGTPVPENATAVILNLDGSIATFEFAPNVFPDFQSLDAGELVSVGHVFQNDLEDGSTVVTGSLPPFTHVDGVAKQGILRILADGSVDSAFHFSLGFPPGAGTTRVDLRETAPGKLLMYGNFTSINGESRPGIARILIDDGESGPAEWIASYGLPNDPALLASGDSDFDGVPDLIELAFRMNPLHADANTLAAGDSRGLPSASLTTTGPTGRLRLTFPRRRDRSELGLTYTPQFSSNLDGTSTPGTEIGGITIDATWEVVTFEDSVPNSAASQRFGRVRIGL